MFTAMVENTVPVVQSRLGASKTAPTGQRERDVVAERNREIAALKQEVQYNILECNFPYNVHNRSRH